jgi:transposase
VSSSFGSRIRRTWGASLPARPRALGEAPTGAARLLTSSKWRMLASRLCSSGERAEQTRSAAAAALWILHTGRSWSALSRSFPKPGVCRRQWREWMRDGRWIEFWSAYVSLLSPRERLAWARAFSRAPEGGGTARHAWWLVSARLLLDGPR